MIFGSFVLDFPDHDNRLGCPCVQTNIAYVRMVLKSQGVTENPYKKCLAHTRMITNDKSRISREMDTFQAQKLFTRARGPCSRTMLKEHMARRTCSKSNTTQAQRKLPTQERLQAKPDK